MQYEHTAGIDTSLGIDGVDRGKQWMFGSSISRREPGRWSTDGGKGGGVVIAKYYLHILGSLILIIPSNKFGVLNSWLWLVMTQETVFNQPEFQFQRDTITNLSKQM